MSLDTNKNTSLSLQPTDDYFGTESDDGVIGLVPYGFHSDSDKSCDMPIKNKKRMKRVQMKNDAWFEAKNKKRRECGKSYLGRRKESGSWNYNNKKEARAMKSRCNCAQGKSTSTMKCPLITDLQRQEIFTNFWKMDWNQKKIYINTLVNTTQSYRIHNRTNRTVSRRTRSLQYHLKFNNETVRVCRTFFINTLNIGRRSVLSWVKKPLVANENATRSVREIFSEKKNLNLFFDCLPLM